jgi:hypothetical protein
MKKLKSNLVMACVAISISIGTQASADPIVYGDIAGEQLTYKGITENSTTDPFPDNPSELFTGLYGTPSSLGDSLLFNVPSFAALAINGPAVDITDGFLTFELSADEGMMLNNLYVEEFGSINTHSPLGGTDLTNVGVVSPIFLDVRQIVVDDGTIGGRVVDVDNPVTISGLSLDITPMPDSDGVYGYATNPDVISWVAETNIDLVAELIASRPDIDDMYPVLGIKTAQFSMNNTMTASAEDVFATAFIDKKQVTINPTVIPVPEPMLPMLVLLLPLALFGRRR